MEKYIYDALYYYKEDDDEGYDLFNVQLLENKDPKRIDILKNILNNEDKYIAYQAMLILIAWGVEEGFNKFDEFVVEAWYKEIEFEPHRIHDEDNVFDVISDAFDIAWSNVVNKNRLIASFKKILTFYHSMYFEGKLKAILIKRKELTNVILQEVKNALVASLEAKKYYQASQLLAVVKNYDKETVAHYLPVFTKLVNEDARIKFNLEELEAV